MKHFIVAAPFNGFPFFLKKTNEIPIIHSASMPADYTDYVQFVSLSKNPIYMNLYDAMELFWLKRIESIYLSASGTLIWDTMELTFDIQNSIQVNRSFIKMGNESFMLEPYKRVILKPENYLFSASKSEYGSYNFDFRVSVPYTDDYRNFAVDVSAFWSFKQHGVNFCVTLGRELDRNENVLKRLASKNVKFLDRALPLTLYGAFTGFDVDGFTVNANISEMLEA